jgi:hypothetical protein
MMSQSFIKEKTLSPDQVLVENLFNQETLSSSSLEDTEEEES